MLLLKGPSGCGKSTWLALGAALVAPAAGMLTVADQNLNALKFVAIDVWRAGAIGFLRQRHRLSAARTVYQNLAQRVALACAVLLQPQVILADEPTASLDDAAAADAVGLLVAAAKTQDATLAIATHDVCVAGLIPPGDTGPIGLQPQR